MTRTQLTENDPHNTRKAFRAQARAQGLTYPQAIAAAVARTTADGSRPEFAETDASRRKLAAHLYRAQEQGAQDAWDAYEQETLGDFPEQNRPEQVHEVNLLDIAKPARRRGHAKNRRQANLDLAAGEQWEQWTEASFGTESEAWELDSVLSRNATEEWEIPEREYSAEEWNTLYAARFEQSRR
uniref:Uncharacterized protein n=1 Tax=Mycena chlorophos TaxID=658473 RepID=A0ABQ0LDD5_MYCCL|nr:predicted protein [Mycena chlorophos]